LINFLQYRVLFGNFLFAHHFFDATYFPVIMLFHGCITRVQRNRKKLSQAKSYWNRNVSIQTTFWRICCLAKNIKKIDMFLGYVDWIDTWV